MNNKLLLQHCDPRLKYNEKQVLSLLNMHAILSNEIVVQDNFLVSELFYKIKKYSKIQTFDALLSEKILNIASRDSFDYSLLSLKNDLQKKAHRGWYEPFEGFEEGLKLYRNIDFIKYIDQLDKNLRKYKNNFRSWSPIEVGKNLRRLMVESAENGISGLEIEIANDVINAVDSIALKRNEDLIHSRTMYADYIKTLNDIELGNKIWSWVSLMYIKNLPDKLSVGLSLSNKTLISEYSYDPFEFAKNKELFDRYNDFGNISAAIFSPDFLVNLHPKSILKIRDFDEFKNLQRAINGNDRNEKISALTEYFTRLSDEAPKFYEPFRKKIRNLEILEKTKFKLFVVSELFAIAAGTYFHEPIYSGMISVLSLLLESNKTIEKSKKKTMRLSKRELYRTKLNNEIKNLGDVCHRLESKEE